MHTLHSDQLHLVTGGSLHQLLCDIDPLDPPSLPLAQSDTDLAFPLKHDEPLVERERQPLNGLDDRAVLDPLALSHLLGHDPVGPCLVWRPRAPHELLGDRGDVEPRVVTRLPVRHRHHYKHRGRVRSGEEAPCQRVDEQTV